MYGWVQVSTYPGDPILRLHLNKHDWTILSISCAVQRPRVIGKQNMIISKVSLTLRCGIKCFMSDVVVVNRAESLAALQQHSHFYMTAAAKHTLAILAA